MVSGFVVSEIVLNSKLSEEICGLWCWIEICFDFFLLSFVLIDYVFLVVDGMWYVVGVYVLVKIKILVF